MRHLILSLALVAFLAFPHRGWCGTMNQGGSFRNSNAAAAENGINVNGKNTPRNQGTTLSFSQTSNPGVAIPDKGSVTNTMTIIPINLNSTSFPITKVTVDLNVTTTFLGDLVVTLGHGGSTSTLISNVGTGRVGFNGTFDDAGTSISQLDIVGGILTVWFQGKGPVVTGTWGPQSPLTVFSFSSSSSSGSTVPPAQDLRGAWTLTIQDTLSSDVATFASWALHVTTSVQAAYDSKGQLIMTRGQSNGGSLQIFNVGGQQMFNGINLSRKSSQP